MFPTNDKHRQDKVTKTLRLLHAIQNDTTRHIIFLQVLYASIQTRPDENSPLRSIFNPFFGQLQCRVVLNSMSQALNSNNSEKR